MKKFRTISVIFSSIGLLFSAFLLFAAFQSIGAEDLNGIGVIFFIPAILAVGIILFVLLISLDKIKKGFLLSWISTLLKLGIIFYFVIEAIEEYQIEIRGGISNLQFDLFVITFLIAITIPSILNIIKFCKPDK